MKLPVGLAGQGEHLGWGKPSLGKQVGAVGEEWGARWMRPVCFGLRFFLKKEKLL